MTITTAGESHGKGLFCIIEGLPSGMRVDLGEIDGYLALRQSGYGRGARQKIECDRAEILSGVRDGMTLGSPLTLAVWNRDYENWKEYMAPEGCDTSRRTLTKVRPGHADLTGLKKYGGTDARNILERASARETAVRVAAGTVCRQFLRGLGVEVRGYVRAAGGVSDEREYSFDQLAGRRPDLFMMDADAERAAMAAIDACKEAGDTCGGIAEVRVKGLKCGFGSCMSSGEKLDGRLAGALMAVQAVKGVEFGLGFSAAMRRGSEVHDEVYYDAERGYFRTTNRAGGVEGGMSNGEELVVRLAMKPIPTLMRGLNTVDYLSHEAVRAATERSDVCAIKAFTVIAESVLCTELSKIVSERLGGDRMEEIAERYGRLPV